MNRPGIARWLRIIWTVLCATVAVLLCVLWVRSYKLYENVTANALGVEVEISSGKGTMLYSIQWSTPRTPEPARYLTYCSHPVLEGGLYSHKRKFELLYVLNGKAFIYSRSPTYVILPNWLIVVVFATSSATPWLPWRFSLRTLLIAITLGSIVLGLVVWLIR